jgi:hypothetical protein
MPRFRGNSFASGFPALIAGVILTQFGNSAMPPTGIE